MSAASAAESAQSVLQSGSRLLLMIAMALFLAYLLFLLCTVTISSAVTTWHALRAAIHSRKHANAAASAVSGSRGSHAVRAGEHALSA